MSSTTMSRTHWSGATPTTAMSPAARGTAPAARGTAPASTLRLTRRGRAVVVAATLAAGFAFFGLRSAPAASTDVVHHQPTRTVIVTPGDTLWDIARRVDPGADPRSVVAEIEQLNSLSDGGYLDVGQPLVVPVG